MTPRHVWLLSSVSIALGFLSILRGQSSDQSRGLVLQKWSGTLNVPDPVACAVDPQGHVYVTSTSRRRVADLDLLSAAERHELLHEWNRNSLAVPQDTCAHLLFEAQAEKTPNSIAAEFAGQRIQIFIDPRNHAPILQLQTLASRVDFKYPEVICL